MIIGLKIQQNLNKYILKVIKRILIKSFEKIKFLFGIVVCSQQHQRRKKSLSNANEIAHGFFPLLK